MTGFPIESNRSNLYKSIVDKLSKKAFDSLDSKGKSLIDPKEGSIWVGSVIYVIGELYRVQKIDLPNYHQKDLIQLSYHLIKDWKSQSEIDTCFMGIGLSAWGTLNDSHPIFSRLNTNEKENLKSQLKVTQEFKNNWEAFNACIEAPNTILLPFQTNTLTNHLKKILDKYTATGFMDDSDGFGVYDSYGIMSLNYCVKALEILDKNNKTKKEQLKLFKPHCLRYAELIKSLMYPDGSGWSFGRSIGVLGQLQYIIFLEQCLYHHFFESSFAAWARSAIKTCVIKMIDLFWDDEKQWFCFRDDFHTCYSYRNTYPMHWDLLRYLTQAFEYAKADEQISISNIAELIPEKKCKEILTDPKRKTSIFLWSDTKVQFVLPIMGCSMGKLSSDTAAKPHCRGLIEGVTENLKPIWVPSLTIEGKNYYPANRFLKSSISHKNEWDIYEVIFDKIYHGQKEDSSYSKLQVKTQYCFATDKFKRIDIFTASENIMIENLNMEILQASAHPKRAEGYGKVYQIIPTLLTNIPNVIISSKIEIGNDLTYRNFFGRPSHKWLISGKNISLSANTPYKLEASIQY